MRTFLRIFFSVRDEESASNRENPSTLLDTTFEFRQRQQRPFSFRYPR